MGSGATLVIWCPKPRGALQLRYRRSVSPGQQFVDPINFVIGNAAEHVCQPGLRITVMESCGACDGADQLQMLIPDPWCDRTERFRGHQYTTSLTGLSAFLELTVLYKNKTPGL